MTPLSTSDAERRDPTSIKVSRGWCRGGLLTDLSWTEAFVLFQILWNQPLRAHRIFGVEERFRRRILSRLHSEGYIEKTEDGYRAVPEFEPRDGEDFGYLWLWPLRWGNVSIAARVAFILIEEQTRGRRWVNRARLAKELGICRTTLYAQLDELEEAGLVLPWGKRKDKKIVCFNHLPDLKEEVMTSLLSHPDYEREDGSEEVFEGGSETNTGRVENVHREGRGRTPRGSETNTRAPSGLALGSPRTHLTPEGEGTAKILDVLVLTASEVLRRNGAEKVPHATALRRDLEGVLQHLTVPEKHLTRFLDSMKARMQGSTSFMWRNLLADCAVARDAALEAVKQAIYTEKVMKSVLES